MIVMTKIIHLHDYYKFIQKTIILILSELTIN